MWGDRPDVARGIIVRLDRPDCVNARDVGDLQSRSDGADPQVMLSVLQHLDERFGGVRQYLLGAGVQPHHLDAIHDRCRVTDPAN